MTNKKQKVQVSKKQAELIDELIYNSLWTKEDIIESHIEGWGSVSRQPLNELSLTEMITAIFVGYEIEERVTFPKEVSEGEVGFLVGLFNDVKKSTIFTYEDGIKDGIIRTLTHLNIKVKGINK